MIRVALRVPVGRSLPDMAAFIARCEDAGLDGVGIHDHPSSGRDAYLALALAAQATKRLRLFPATSSPVVRHPLVLASLAHSLEMQVVAEGVERQDQVEVLRELKCDVIQGFLWGRPQLAPFIPALITSGVADAFLQATLVEQSRAADRQESIN